MRERKKTKMEMVTLFCRGGWSRIERMYYKGHISFYELKAETTTLKINVFGVRSRAIRFEVRESIL